MQTNSSQVISKYLSRPHILVYMLNIATAEHARGRTSPGLPYKRSFLITVKLHAMVLSFLKS